MSDNRINSLSISSEGPRQTPNESFGRTLASTLAKGTSSAVGLAAGALGGANPVLSAAVSQGASVIGSFVAAAGSGSATGGASGETSVLQSANGGTDSASLLKEQEAMNAQSQQFNMMYLQLQDSMQRESREYETISNIMKVRHDTAKNAINNIH